jgi:hypothetical protein
MTACPIRALLAACVALLLVGCGGGDPAPAPAEPAAKPGAMTHAEGELRKVGVASAVGYDGQALEGDVRRTVETQEAQAAETEAARRAAAGD